MALLGKYLAARRAKDSVLCVGLDPASPYMRKGEQAVPAEYFRTASELEGLLTFCLEIVEKTGKWAVAYKLNAQYALPFSLADYKRITAAIKKQNSFAILDIKLGDIGSSNEACFYWAAQAGFDAVTFSPFAGNVSEAARQARERGLGLFVLTLMSNPEAGTFMRAPIANAAGTTQPAYLWIAQEIAKNGIEGAVVGATNTTALELKQIRDTVGKDVIFLVPGIGAQGGDAERIFGHGGENLLINVGRSIINSSNPRKAAEDFCANFRGMWKGKQ